MTFIHYRATENIGDLACCPAEYFPEFKDCVRLDFQKFWDAPTHGPVVFGGGGMIGCINGQMMAALVQRKKFIWGAGINEHGKAKRQYRAWLEEFDLVGLRDFGNPFEYVPCVSCMHSAFDDAGTPEHEVVIYEHYDHPIPMDGPKRNNSGTSMEDCAAFLKSGKSVVTNSYHGAYWALLLGRSVQIYKPFSNRFFGFEPIVSIWPSPPRRAEIDYLEFCRARNVRFKDMVLSLL